ncbi:primase-helicase family protein [Synechococcus sp. RS9907]|uniref:primase-helicase family protein n=1 Tax=Synechococcus sp. RS9907 TaxID=221350 RepID=UPI00165E449D|nr:primase-helicase family protein [Synechococcus sp. RS9907]
MEVSEKIFDWTLTTLEVIGGMAGDINTEHLIERVHDRSDLFTTWTLKFLPALPLVESTDDEGKVDLVPQRPLKDMDEQAHVCFQNGVVVVTKHRPPTLIPYFSLPPEIFVWEKQIRPADFQEENLEEGPHGIWWDFMQNLAQEKQSGRWVVNHGMLKTLVTSYGYLLHNFYPPENRRAIVFYDRTTEWKAGGNGKSIIAKSFQHIKPWHFVDMKKEKTGENRFLMSGFTPDKEIVVLSDTTKDFELETLYNQITDGFTVEDKGVDKLVIDEDKAPKLVITTNYTISTTHRSDRRRIWFAPISTYYGEQEDLTGKTPADFHGGRLCDKKVWDSNEWSAFYSTCVYCLDQYLKNGLVKFEDNVMAERQLLKVCYGDQMLLDELTKFIKGVVSNGSEVSKDEVIAFYGYYPEFERFSEYSSKWKTSTFKNVCTGLGYRVNPDRPNGRWLKTVNGENKDWYLLDAQKGVMTGAESGDTPQEPQPEPEPVVTGGRFSDFLFDSLEATV